MTTNTPFTMVSNAVMFDATLPALVRVCYSALEHFSGQHRTCWPGYEAIAKKVGCSSRWIPVLLKRLVEAGLLLVEYRQGKSNIYTLLGRVERQKATQEYTPPAPWKSIKDEPEPVTKTKEDRAYRRFNQPKRAGIDFSKYQPGGKYPAAVI